MKTVEHNTKYSKAKVAHFSSY